MTLPGGIGLLVLALSLAARAGTRNAYVKRKLLLSVVLAAGNLLAHAFPLWAGTPPGIARTLDTIAPVLLTLAASNLIVLLAVNPFRQDRLPDHFPAILQDAITVAVFVTVVVLFFNDRLQLTAAAGAVVLGLALQSTLGNAIAGLALQADHPYKVGDWIQVGDHEGRVTQISWRSTLLRTRDSTLVALPNSSIADGPIVNFSEPAPPTRIAVDVGVSYTIPPNQVKGVIVAAMTEVPLAMPTPPPDVLLVEFGASAITYRIRCFVQDMERSSLAQDQIRTALWYAFQRHGIEIPYPIQVEYAPGVDADGLAARAGRPPGTDWQHGPARRVATGGARSTGRVGASAPLRRRPGDRPPGGHGDEQLPRGARRGARQRCSRRSGSGAARGGPGVRRDVMAHWRAAFRDGDRSQ